MSAWIWCRRRRTRRWREGKLLSFLWNLKSALQVEERFMIHLKQFGKGIDTWMTGLCQHNFNSKYFCRLSVFFLPARKQFPSTQQQWEKSEVFSHNYRFITLVPKEISYLIIFDFHHHHLSIIPIHISAIKPPSSALISHDAKYFAAIEINQLCDIINFLSPFYAPTHTHFAWIPFCFRCVWEIWWRL